MFVFVTNVLVQYRYTTSLKLVINLEKRRLRQCLTIAASLHTCRS